MDAGMGWDVVVVAHGGEEENNLRFFNHRLAGKYLSIAKHQNEHTKKQNRSNSPAILVSGQANDNPGRSHQRAFDAGRRSRREKHVG
jgi:hypothetical protein